MLSAFAIMRSWGFRLGMLVYRRCASCVYSLLEVGRFLGLVCQIHSEVEKNKELIIGQLR
jgi:hypothetical protein